MGLLHRFGGRPPAVDTVLTDPNTGPGRVLDGQVIIIGGARDVVVGQVVLGLVTRVEVENEEGEYGASVEFHRDVASRAFALAAAARHTLPFRFCVPWETPITHVDGQRLPGMTMALRTRLAVDRRIDESDLDEVRVHPLAVHQHLLWAFAGLGFTIKDVELRTGRISGVDQRLPFYQEVAFRPPPSYAPWMGEAELAVVADGEGAYVLLGLDKWDGIVAGDPDRIGRFRVDHATVDRHDWRLVVHRTLRDIIQRDGRSSPGHGPALMHGDWSRHRHWMAAQRPHEGLEAVSGPSAEPGAGGGAGGGGSGGGAGDGT
jgi:sporulation-control protein